MDLAKAFTFKVCKEYAAGKNPKPGRKLRNNALKEIDEKLIALSERADYQAQRFRGNVDVGWYQDRILGTSGHLDRALKIRAEHYQGEVAYIVARCLAVISEIDSLAKTEHNQFLYGKVWNTDRESELYVQCPNNPVVLAPTADPPDRELWDEQLANETRQTTHFFVRGADDE